MWACHACLCVLLAWSSYAVPMYDMPPQLNHIDRAEAPTRSHDDHHLGWRSRGNLFLKNLLFCHKHWHMVCHVFRNRIKSYIDLLCSK